jgi:predicted deacylase
VLLETRRIIGKNAGPRLLVTGGVHGDEFEPMAAIRRLCREIGPDDLNGTLTLVPVVNEPAFRRGERTGDDGLDLARTCPGRADGSATEQIAAALTDLIRDADYYIDLHTGGTRLTVLPLAGYMLHRDQAVLTAQRRMALAFDLPIVWGTDPDLDGRSLSVARDALVPAIYAEYLGGGGCSPSGVEAYVHGCLRVLAELGMWSGKRPVCPSRHDASVPRILVEDDRPGAGHMQVNHPSPCEGFFEPAVTLGQRVAAGELLGSVTDLLGSHSRPLQARYAGIVLVLHTFARVDAGTGLVVILDTSASRTLSEFPP